MSAQPDRLFGSAANDADAQETREWVEALAAVIDKEGRDRGHFLLEQRGHEVRRRARAAQLGYQSSIIMPLVSEGHVLGAMSIHARERDADDEEEIKLVTELASDLAFGIPTLRTRVARE